MTEEEKVILRKYLPWDLPAERLEAMARGWWEAQSTVAAPRSWDLLHPTKQVLAWEYALEAYRADPIMRELWPERFNVAP